MFENNVREKLILCKQIKKNFYLDIYPIFQYQKGGCFDITKNTKTKFSNFFTKKNRKDFQM